MRAPWHTASGTAMANVTTPTGTGVCVCAVCVWRLWSSAPCFSLPPRCIWFVCVCVPVCAHCRYEGAWTAGARGGGGGLFEASVASLASGDKDTHVGDWRDSQRSAMGKMIYADGRVYQGLWTGGQRHGYGTLLTPGLGLYSGEVCCYCCVCVGVCCECLCVLFVVAHDCEREL